MLEFPVQKAEDEGGVLLEEEEEDMYNHARPGDQYMIEFQCDVCQFRNVNGRNPAMESWSDVTLLRYIRRANLDAFWGRASKTIGGNLGVVNQHVKFGKELGLKDPLPARGPFRLSDDVGMKEAVLQLRRTRDKGRYDKFIQYGTARKFRSGFSNFWNTTPLSSAGAVMARDTSKLFVSNNPTYGRWWEKFLEGMHNRMGDDVRPDLAISLKVMGAMLRFMELNYSEAIGKREKAKIASFAMFSIAGYLGGLRGEEIVKLDLFGLNAYFADGKSNNPPFVPITLIGKFKGETGVRHHILPLSWTTDSGIQCGKWTERFLEGQEFLGRSRGWAFVDEDGKRCQAKDFEPELHHYLEMIQKYDSSLINQLVNVREDYGVSRSYRRGSNTEAQNRGISAADCERNNRWRKVEAAKGKAISQGMRDRYTDIKQAVVSLLRYSQGL